jgi:hypothetical protein
MSKTLRFKLARKFYDAMDWCCFQPVMHHVAGVPERLARLLDRDGEAWMDWRMETDRYQPWFFKSLKQWYEESLVAHNGREKAEAIIREKYADRPEYLALLEDGR